MRLTAIKLAGFKSFVDPVHIPVAGQMVGVVGPNGCGKSNVIDAVRWVLGESQARHLRGSSMTDVIFNGSSGRKPVSRASVELLFDNSDGRAAGAWSQYAELSVKRVLTRSGDSVYYINQMQVRRRDLLDVFLGTGLSARTSYAIIEQGMISRIIDARPDELRAFLEEAAGISRYKERRRETETRLEHARENLLRLNDVRQSLAEQIERLTSQAETARLWQGMQADLLRNQQMLWLLRWREARQQLAALEQDIRQLEHQLQSRTDELSAADIALIALRERHAACNVALNDAQGRFYAAVSETSRLEQMVQHTAQTRRQLEQQASHLERQAAAAEEEMAANRLAHSKTEASMLVAQTAAEQASQALAALLADVPASESQEREQRLQVSRLQSELAESEQAVQIARTHIQHLQRQAEAAEQRYQKLVREQQSLPAVDSEGLQQLTLQHQAAEQEHAAAQASLERLQGIVATGETERRDAQSALQTTERELHLAEGELAGLRAAQRHDTQNQPLESKLAQAGLADVPRLWQVIEADAEWSAAIENLLGERLQALMLDDAGWQMVLSGDFPGITALLAGEIPGNETSGMLAHVALRNQTNHALHDWLGHLRPVASLAEARQVSHTLAPGELMVTPEGHLVGRYSLMAASGGKQAEQGVLARRQAMERLEQTTDELRARTTVLRERLVQAQAALEENRRQLDVARREQTRLQQDAHRLQIELVNRRQQQEQLKQRSERLQQELTESHTASTAGREEMHRHQSALELHNEKLAGLKTRLAETRQRRQEAELALGQLRTRQRKLENEVQEARYNVRLDENRLSDLVRTGESLAQRMVAVQQEREAVQASLLTIDDKTPASALEQALVARQQAEQSLAISRNALEAAQGSVREAEEQRMRLEQSLDPLRSQLEAVRLKRGEVAASAEHAREQMQAFGASETMLTDEMPGIRLTSLVQRINRLEQEMKALGAVNLLALEELEQATERDRYLSEQHADLQAAMDTLVAAIQSMDQETRSLFRSTFETVNTSMSELFASLFGGGKAELALTEGEWLDAGVQVMAQPPGKKNSSIQLLSGGEKALTALSLVFSLFRLNPAPFCLLDEVDAPLDDTNTERYARLVRQMSESVQFLFITHNRITMEAASQLVGVTMQEPGVSRIVSVDLEEATRLASV